MATFMYNGSNNMMQDYRGADEQDDDSSYSSSSGSSDGSSDLSTIDSGTNEAPVVRKQLFRNTNTNTFSQNSNPKNSGSSNQQHHYYNSGSGTGSGSISFHKPHSHGMNTPNTVPMSQYSPGSSIVTPNSAGLHYFPKMPQMPPPESVSCKMANPGSLAAALGMKIDTSDRAAPIRERGQSAPPVQTHYGTTFVGYSAGRNTAAAVAKASMPRPGSLAAALSMMIDASDCAAPIRETGCSAPPIQTHRGTTHRSFAKKQKNGKNKKKKSLMDIVMKRVQGKNDDDDDHSDDSDDDDDSISYYQPGQTYYQDNSMADDEPADVFYAKAGSLAAALGMKVDTARRAAPIREIGHTPPPIQTHMGTTFYEYADKLKQKTIKKNKRVNNKNTTTPKKKSLADMVFARMGATTITSSTTVDDGPANNSRAVVTAKAGSLAAALGIKIDASYQAAPIRERGHTPPPVQTHFGTTFVGYYSNNNNRPKRSLMDTVLTRVRSNSVDRSFDYDDYNDEAPQRSSKAKAGSLAAALGMTIDVSNRAAPIREVGHTPPPIQTHYGTTFHGSKYHMPSNNNNNNKKSLMDIVMSRVSIDDDDDDSSLDDDDSYVDQQQQNKTKHVVMAKAGSLAAALGMKIDASYQAAPIRERGHSAPPVQTHYGTTFKGSQYHKPKKSLADMVFSRMGAAPSKTTITNKSPPKKTLMDAVMSKVNIADDDGDDTLATYDDEDDYSVDEQQVPVMSAKAGSLAAALGMKVDVSNRAAAIRERGHTAPPVQTHYGTTFIGHYSAPPPKPSGGGGGLWTIADMTMTRRKNNKAGKH